MKPFWKWVIGIVLGLLALAILAGIPLAMHSWRPAGLEVAWGGSGWGMRGFQRMPMMHGFSGPGFMSFGGIFAGLFQLGLLALLVVGIVWAVRAVKAQRLPARSCTKCGRAVQEDWKVCPHCANKL